MTTLKPDPEMLGQRLATSEASFAETIRPEQRDYMFVLEQPQDGSIAGVCAIKGAVGLTEPNSVRARIVVVLKVRQAHVLADLGVGLDGDA